jgi:hypothetical protein
VPRPTAELKKIRNSIRWLASYADIVDASVDELIMWCYLHAASPDDFSFEIEIDMDQSNATFDRDRDDTLLWHHFYIVTGDTLPSGRSQNFFECVC